jgi:hypothetical protein
MPATPEEIAAATFRREEIVAQLLEFMCDRFTTAELQRYRLIAHLFCIEPVVAELTADSSTLAARTEKALAIAMCAMAVAMDDSKPATPQRILQRNAARKESRDAEKVLRESLIAKVAVKPGKPQSAQASTIAPERR